MVNPGPDGQAAQPAVRHEEDRCRACSRSMLGHTEISSTFADLDKSQATVGGTSGDQPAKRKKPAKGLSLEESRHQALWCCGPDGPVRTRRRRR